jgi:hypothetical protein
MKSQLAAGFKLRDAAQHMDEARRLHDNAPTPEWHKQLNLLKDTLAIWIAKSQPDSKLKDQVLREELLKKNFVLDYRAAQELEKEPRVFVRFGRNHGHRAYDRHGVSTLGNFVAEFAAAQGGSMFNVGVFSGGGKVVDEDAEISMHERVGDRAFQFLADRAENQATVFDLRPLRQLLNNGGDSSRRPFDESLQYWADSYDALIYYPSITQMRL